MLGLLMNGISQNIAFPFGNKLVYASCQLLNQETIVVIMVTVVWSPKSRFRT